MQRIIFIIIAIGFSIGSQHAAAYKLLHEKEISMTVLYSLDAENDFPAAREELKTYSVQLQTFYGGVYQLHVEELDVYVPLMHLDFKKRKHCGWFTCSEPLPSVGFVLSEYAQIELWHWIIEDAYDEIDPATNERLVRLWDNCLVDEEFCFYGNKAASLGFRPQPIDQILIEGTFMGWYPRNDFISVSTFFKRHQDKFSEAQNKMTLLFKL